MKGYIFMTDLTLALIIAVIGLSILLVRVQEEDPTTIFITQQLSADVVNVLGETKMSDVCVNPATSSCNCRYASLTAVCSDVQNSDQSLLSVLSQMVEQGYPRVEIENIIEELFVTTEVIDERRFGFSVIYDTPSASFPLELYNSERVS